MLNSPSGEFGGCSWRLLRGGPAHQRVLPALPGVKVHLPLLGVVDARLHGRLGRHEDVNLPCFDVFLGDPGQGGDVLGGGGQRGGQHSALSVSSHWDCFHKAGLEQETTIQTQELNQGKAKSCYIST